jgi:hypothetical protein
MLSSAQAPFTITENEDAHICIFGSESFRKMDCACCGAEMSPDKETEKIIIYKCKQCGLSDTRLKDTR